MILLPFFFCIIGIHLSSAQNPNCSDQLSKGILAALNKSFPSDCTQITLYEDGRNIDVTSESLSNNGRLSIPLELIGFKSIVYTFALSGFPSIKFSNFSITTKQQLTNVSSLFLHNCDASLGADAIEGSFNYLEVTNSSFHGSALCSNCNSKEIRIFSSTFSNTPKVAIPTVNGNIIVRDSSFIQNTGQTSGDLYTFDGIIKIYNSKFSGSKGEQGGSIHAASVFVFDSSFNSTVGSIGGAIWTSESALVERCTFSGSKASSQGGDLHGKHFTVYDSSFENSYAGTYGGSVNSLDGGSVSIYNSTFRGISTDSQGGVIYTNGQGNTTLIIDCKFKDCKTKSYGSVLRSGRNLYAKNSSFGSGIAYQSAQGGSMYCDGSQVEIDGCEFTSNYATDYGGALFITQSSIIRNTKFTNNSVGTTGKGGAFYQFGNNSTVTGCFFEKNTAAYGGAIFGALIISNTFFKENNATSYGGAVHSTSDLSVVGCSYERNNANEEGGGIYSEEDMLIRDSRFSFNSAIKGGGGFSSRQDLHLFNSLFISNIATNGNGGGFLGADDTEMINNQFYLNNAKDGASFFLTDATATVTNYYGGTNGGPNVFAIKADMKGENLNLGCDWLRNSTSVYKPDYVDWPDVVSISPSTIETEGEAATFTLLGSIFNPILGICNSVTQCQAQVQSGSGRVRKIGNYCYFNSTLNYTPPSINLFDSATGIVSGKNFGREIGRIYAELIPSYRTCTPISITKNSTEFVLDCPQIATDESLTIYVGGVSATIGVISRGVSQLFNQASDTKTIYDLVYLFFRDPTASNPLVLDLSNINIAAYDLRRTRDESTSLNLSSQSLATINTKEQDANPSFMVFFTSSHSEKEIYSKDPITISFSSKIHGLSLLDDAGNPLEIKDSTGEISITMAIQNITSNQQLEGLECLYWDNLNSNWSTKGCRKGAVSLNQIECLCDHLTNFTIGKGLVSSSQQQSTPSKTPIGLIIGVVVGASLLLIIIIIIVILLVSRSKKKENSLLELSTTGLEDKIVIERKIGQGGFGSVYLANYCSTTSVALKLLSKDSDGKANLIREATIMKELHHPNVVLFLQSYQTREGEFGLMMEYIPNGNLLDALRGKSLAYKEKLSIICDIAGGMRYLHESEVIHCDLSSRNVLLTQGNRAKISDFGSAKKNGEKRDFQVKNASRWSPPEVLKGGEFTFEGDVFSFGITCWEISSDGLIPYGSMSTNDVISFVLSGDRLSIPSDYEEWNPIISQCWEEERSKRSSVKSISEFFLNLSGTSLSVKKKEKKFQDEEDEGTYITSIK